VFLVRHSSKRHNEASMNAEDSLSLAPIRLDWGWPSPELQATKSFASVVQTTSQESDFSDALFYGQRQGNLLERESLAAAISLPGLSPVEPDALVLTSGAGVALDLILGAYASTTSVCFTESLTYHNALKIIRDRGYTTVPLARKLDGSLDFMKIEEQFRANPGALTYVIPSFSNPCGETMSPASRQALVGLASQFEIVVIADEVYRFLSFGEDIGESLARLDPTGATVASLGSFTKLAGPGLRLGWIEFGCPAAESKLAQSILETGVMINGGCLNQFSASMVGKWLRAEEFQPHLAKIRVILARRAEAFSKALGEQLDPLQVQFEAPQGGYFLWMKPVPGRQRDLSQVLEAAGVGARDASAFSSANDGSAEGVRLSFSYYGEAALEEAALRIGRSLTLTT